ncbi:hypothetical protein AB0L70_15130 [Kribbella sp. NPDC051952]|uniref:hypothetical protein n=1 Tax=Kribbella sp. NPDC051952 TaxID=3154851 RepID=UPI003436BA55
MPSSAPVTSTTSAPDARSFSARAAQSANNGSISAPLRSQRNGANHTSRPRSTACSAAIVNRSGSLPVMRTALQCSSPAITSNSRRAVAESNAPRVLRPIS